MPFVRLIEACRPARQAAPYHVLVSAGGAPFEIRLETDRAPLRVDAVTALVVGPVALRDLNAKLHAGDAVLAMSVPNARSEAWLSAAVNELEVRRRPAARTLVMSSTALLLAERVRQRRRRTDQSARAHACYAVAAEDRACVNALLGELLRDVCSDARPVDLRRSTPRSALVDRARRLLASCPGSPHRLTALADSLGVSTFHFARVFRGPTDTHGLDQ